MKQRNEQREEGKKKPNPVLMRRKLDEREVECPRELEKLERRNFLPENLAHLPPARRMNSELASSPSSSPPTPPSPLPISVGPGNRRYPFTPSPSPSPPFSPPDRSSPETSPLLHGQSAEQHKQPSAFSLDRFLEESGPSRRWSHLRDL